MLHSNMLQPKYSDISVGTKLLHPLNIFFFDLDGVTVPIIDHPCLQHGPPTTKCKWFGTNKFQEATMHKGEPCMHDSYVAGTSHCLGTARTSQEGWAHKFWQWHGASPNTASSSHLKPCTVAWPLPLSFSCLQLELPGLSFSNFVFLHILGGQSMISRSHFDL